MSYPDFIKADALRQHDRIEYRRGRFKRVLATARRGSRVLALCEGENAPRIMRPSDPLRIERPR